MQGLQLNPYQIQGKLDIAYNLRLFQLKMTLLHLFGWLMEKHVKDLQAAFLLRGNCWVPCSSSPQKVGKGFPLNPFGEADGHWTSLWYRMTSYLMENQEEEPQMKKLCNIRTVVELFARCFQPSKSGAGGQKSKSAALLACTGRSGWEKCAGSVWKGRKWVGQFD